MPSDINFNYYTSSEFLNNQEITDCIADNAFSFLHCNIRSVSANLDNLNHLLFELDCSFTIIGLTETKIITSKDPVINLNLPGFQFVSQPSLSNAGGVGFYIRDKYTFSIRTDLSKAESGFEVLWIEIENNAHSNLLCGVVYRHSQGDITSFMEYLNSSVDKIHRENKICVVMGDFNLDLLKFETHNDTDAFLNAKKIKRSIGILSKLRYYVTLDTLISPYFALLYPFLIYGIVIWGNTYPTNIKPVFILQKRAIRLITFSKFDEHTSPLFKITCYPSY